MASLKSLQGLISQPSQVEQPVKVKEPEVISEDDEETFYLYPFKTKREAAIDLKEWFDNTEIPDIISIKCTRLKKEIVKDWFELVKKYWNDETYVYNRLADLKTIREFIK